MADQGRGKPKPLLPRRPQFGRREALLKQAQEEIAKARATVDERVAVISIMCSTYGSNAW
jgi:hypothetical protein